MIMEVSLPAMAGRKVVVFWNEFKKEAGSGQEPPSVLREFGLDGLSSTILTGAQLKEEGANLNLVPNPDLADDVNDIDFLVKFDKVGDGAYEVAVTTRRKRSEEEERVVMETRQYVSFPHLNSLSGVTSAGAYVMKWSGFALSRIWIELFGWYLIGAGIYFVGRLVMREVKAKRRGQQQTNVEKISPAKSQPTPHTIAPSPKSSWEKIQRHLLKLAVTIVTGVVVGRSTSSAFNDGR